MMDSSWRVLRTSAVKWGDLWKRYVGGALLQRHGPDNWIRMPNVLPAFFNSVAFAAGTFVMAGVGPGFGSTLMRSPDGQHWQSIPDIHVPRITQVAGVDKSFLALGDSGTILQSPPANEQIRLRSARLKSPSQFSSVGEAPAETNLALEGSDDLRSWSVRQVQTNWPGSWELLETSTNQQRFYRLRSALASPSWTRCFAAQWQDVDQ